MRKILFVCALSFIVLFANLQAYSYSWDTSTAWWGWGYGTDNGDAFTYKNEITGAVGGKVKAWELTDPIYMGYPDEPYNPDYERNTSMSEASSGLNDIFVTITDSPEWIYFNIINSGVINGSGTYSVEKYFGLNIWTPQMQILNAGDVTHLSNHWGQVGQTGYTRFMDITKISGSNIISEEGFSGGSYYGDKWFAVKLDPGVYELGYHLSLSAWSDCCYQIYDGNQHWGEAYFPLVIPGDGIPSDTPGDYGAIMYHSGSNPGEELLLARFDLTSGASPIVPEPLSSTLFIVGGATLGLRRLKKKFNKSDLFSLKEKAGS